MKVLTNIIARILFGLPMLGFASFHFMNAEQMAGMAPFGGKFIVYLTGIGLLAGGIAVLIDKMASLATLLLGVFFILTATTVHLPDLLSGNEQAMGTMLKDLALAGGVWYMSGAFKERENDTEAETETTSGSETTPESQEGGTGTITD